MCLCHLRLGATLKTAISAIIIITLENTVLSTHELDEATVMKHFK